MPVSCKRSITENRAKAKRCLKCFIIISVLFVERQIIQMLDVAYIQKELQEEDKTELPLYFPPPIYYSLNTALNLSILLTMPESYKWFYNCMIQLAFNKNWKEDKKNHPLDIYPANMIRIGRHGEMLFIHEHIIDIDGTVIKIEREQFMNHIISWINNGLYILSYVDVSKLPGTKSYGYSELIHDILVFGYDKGKKTVKMVDFDKEDRLSILEVPYLALEESVYLPLKHSPLTLINPRRQVVYDYDLDLFKELFLDYLNGRNTAKRYSHIINSYGDYWWGAKIYEPFREFVRYSNEESKELDYRPFHALYEHKKCMLYSVEYLESNYFIDKNMRISGQIKELISKTDSLRMRALKYNICKSKEDIRRINNLLVTVELKEVEILQNLLVVMGLN